MKKGRKSKHHVCTVEENCIIETCLYSKLTVRTNSLNTNELLDAPSLYAGQGDAEYEELVIDVEACVEGDPKGYTMTTDEIIVGLRGIRYP